MRFSMSAALVPLFAVAAYAAPVVEAVDVVNKRSITGALTALTSAVINLATGNVAVSDCDL